MNRREIREALLCMIFDYSFHTEEEKEEQLRLYLDNFKEEGNLSDALLTDAYFTKAYFGVVSTIDELDEIVEKYSKKWSGKRISRVSKSILRLAIYEIKYMSDIPSQVSINEAVELSKKFDTDDSYTFVNGILGAAVRGMDDEATKADAENDAE